MAFTMTVSMLILAGCAASSPAPVLLTLPPVVMGKASIVSPASTALAASESSSTGRPAVLPVLAMRRLDVPEYLVSRRVRYRSNESTLAEWPDTYWAERIEVGVSREFASALRQQLPAWRLCESQCGDQSPALSLQVELTQMDYVRSARQLRAQAQLIVWTGGNAPRLLRSESRSYEIASDADTPQAQSQSLAEMIRRLAADTAPLITAIGVPPSSSAASPAP